MTPKSPKRILLIRLSAHGDIIQGFDALKELRKRFPHATIGWAVGEAGASLLDAVEPWVDRVHILPKSWSRDWLKLVVPFMGAPSDATLRAVDAIRHHHYDMAIDLQGLYKSAILPWVLRIPQRVGFANPREPVSLLYTHTPARRGSARVPTHHAVKEFSTLFDNYPDSTILPPLAQLPLTPLPSNLLPLLHRLRDAHAHNACILGFAPFTMWESKHWPLDHWATFITQAFEKYPHAVGLCIGSPDDVGKWSLLQRAIPEHLHARLIHAEGITTLMGLMHLLNHIDILIGADSAPLHSMDWLVREGLNPEGKSIALMGATHPKRTGPLHSKSIALTTALPCSPCHKRVCPLGSTACMSMLLPSDVINALSDLIP